MKKTITLFALLLMCSLAAVAQVKVGDNPATIDQSAILEVESTTQGLLPPRMSTAQRDAISNPASGLMIYNTDYKYLEINKGTASNPLWQCLGNPSAEDADGDGTPDVVDSHPNNPCEPLQAAGNTDYDTTNVIWRLADCDGDGRTNGVEADCGSDPYDGSDHCPITLPSGVTLIPQQTHYIVSCYDQNYLPLAGFDANPAATGAANPDGTNEAITVNIQGSLTTTGDTIRIRYHATLDVNLPAFSQIQTIASEHVQGSNANSTQGGGAAVDVELSWEAQTLPPGTGTIKALIKALGNDLNAVKLDINKGIGNDFGIVLATFAVPKDNTGATDDILLKDIAVIPDRNIADANHQFLYVPVQGEDGNTWLNNNLGADYANINHASFDPAQQATARDDHHAYGSLYQWGRLSDGHELITWTSATVGTGVTNTTSTTSASDTPPNGKFITMNSGPYDWRVPQNHSLWQGEAGTNNPCPHGFRLPTEAEWTAYINAAGISNAATAAAADLKLSDAGYRSRFSGSVNHSSSRGVYWSSTVEATYARMFRFTNNTNVVSNGKRAAAYSVRCFKN